MSNPVIDMGDLDNWVEPSLSPIPVPKGVYEAVIYDVNDVRSFQWRGKDIVEFTLTFQVVGGEHDGRLISYIRVNSFPTRGNTSTGVTDLLLCAGYPIDELRGITFDGLIDAIEQLKADGSTVFLSVDWEGFSLAAYQEKLKELTGAEDYETAKNLADKDQRKEAGNYATVFSNYNSFPELPNGEKNHRPKCPITDEPLNARAVVRKFLRV